MSVGDVLEVTVGSPGLGGIFGSAVSKICRSAQVIRSEFAQFEHRTQTQTSTQQTDLALELVVNLGVGMGMAAMRCGQPAEEVDIA